MIHGDMTCTGCGWRAIASSSTTLVLCILMALLSNMGVQATLTKGVVVEYMAKHMTKSGQRALIKIMEHSFALCIEKARDNKQGAGSAVL